MAGHGCTPGDEENQTALLMANSDDIQLGPSFHVLGQYLADWFWRAGCFDEVLLFMDCCRNTIRVPALDRPYAEVLDANAVKQNKRFHAHASKWSQKAWEHEMDDGKVHGVFSTALLDGLKGKAARNGQVTTESLHDFLHNRMKEYLGPDAQEIIKGEQVSEEPEVHDFDQNFVIVTVSSQTFSVRIHLPPSAVGKPVEILGNPEPGPFTVVATTDDPSAVWETQLEPGLYKVQSPATGLLQLIEVGGVREVDVQL
jgi:hypothetical protein